MTKLNIGLDENARVSVAASLNSTLADTYALYMKTHAYHWNVTGPQFHTLHIMFEEQYREMWTALDEIAERVRALGVFAPSSGKALSELSSIENADETPPSATTKLKLVIPPPSGTGSTSPRQIDSPAALALFASFIQSSPSPALRRLLQAPIRRSAMMAMKATQRPATMPRPVSALVSAM